MHSTEYILFLYFLAQRCMWRTKSLFAWLYLFCFTLWKYKQTFKWTTASRHDTNFHSWSDFMYYNMTNSIEKTSVSSARIRYVQQCGLSTRNIRQYPVLLTILIVHFDVMVQETYHLTFPSACIIYIVWSDAAYGWNIKYNYNYKCTIKCFLCK